MMILICDVMNIKQNGMCVLQFKRNLRRKSDDTTHLKQN
jgi:hypothetical protein